MLLQWINKYSNVSLIYIKEICNVTPDGNNVSPLLEVLLYLLTLMYGHYQHNLTLRQMGTEMLTTLQLERHV